MNKEFTDIGAQAAPAPALTKRSKDGEELDRVGGVAAGERAHSAGPSGAIGYANYSKGRPLGNSSGHTLSAIAGPCQPSIRGGGDSQEGAACRTVGSSEYAQQPVLNYVPTPKQAEQSEEMKSLRLVWLEKQKHLPEGREGLLPEHSAGEECGVKNDGMYGLYDEVVDALAEALDITTEDINPNTLGILIRELGKDNKNMRRELRDRSFMLKQKVKEFGKGTRHAKIDRM